MAETKTRPTEVAVHEYVAQIEDAQKRADSAVLIEMMRRVTGEEPKMWGPSIIGFGRYHYKYASGHEGETCVAGFAPRKAEFSIYLWPEAEPWREKLLARLGKHRMGKGCLYVKRLEQIDIGVLEELVVRSLKTVRERFPG